MSIVVKGKHVRTNAALESYATKKVEKFYHFYPKIVKIEIELRSEIAHKKKDSDFICDINVKVPGHTFKISDSEDDLYKAVDLAVKRMNEVLRRESAKHRSRERRFLRGNWQEFGGQLVGHLRKRLFRRES